MRRKFRISKFGFRISDTALLSGVPQIRNPKSEIRNRIDWLGEFFISAVAFVAIAIIFLIFIYVAREAAPLAWRTIDGISIWSPFQPPYVWQPVGGVPKFNILSLIDGTFKVTLIAMLFATPLALAATLYTAEFAPPCLREWRNAVAIAICAGADVVRIHRLRAWGGCFRRRTLSGFVLDRCHLVHHHVSDQLDGLPI